MIQLIYILKFFIKIIKKFYFLFDSNTTWGLGIGDWGLGFGPNPQSPIPIIQNYNYSQKIIK